MKKNRKLSHVLPDYLNYMGLFVGAGLLSGSIVHIPLNPAKFIAIGLVGMAIFVASTVINELKLTKQDVRANLVQLMLFSSILALGVGMISGGIQHFTEFPNYLSKLIPIGMALSIIGYIFGHGINLNREQKVRLGVSTLAVIALTVLVLGVYSSYLTGDKSKTETQNAQSQGEVIESEQNTDGHSHGH